ncbi:hypothetical protein M427DRAFT_30000 [Gonapodya prolifera JEL478]|uniref:RED-like N-terminal domain-containing protein n=1 Tax=Gonapodya prolifera (strain JEL478) TaxID=1344416 RepID=A0A139AM80_GONPJ|nr:hypothetical protein M427DRAFT_30000 [Gonapodya prolifera JEL478]|eukprot:KXS17859.1 hypothetical protein M427DRAFT_30000 [Gonapodya prolifera JEL478]
MSGLGQDDFRRMLATPRSGDGGSSRAFGMKTPRPGAVSELARSGGQGRNSGSGGSGNSGGGKDSFDFKKPEPKKKKPFKKKKAGSDEEDEAKSSNSAYRDRAAERRKGVNPDYEESERILEVLGAGTPRPAAGASATGLVGSTPRTGPDLSKPASSFILPSAIAPSEDLETSAISEDMTQYLGGSISHTHLVRGLDRSLLSRVRSEIEAIDEAERDRLDAEEWERRQREEATATFHSKTAERLHELAVIAPRRVPPEYNDLFVRSRLAWQWELGFEPGPNGLGRADLAAYGGSSDVPTTIVRSKHEPSVQAALVQLADRSERMVIDKLCLAIRQAKISRGEKVEGLDEEEKRRMKREEKERKRREREEARKAAQTGVIGTGSVSTQASSNGKQQASLVVGDPDDDIFADAKSEYVLEVDPQRKARGEAGDGASDGVDRGAEGSVGLSQPTLATKAFGGFGEAMNTDRQLSETPISGDSSTHDRIARLVRAAGGRLDGDTAEETVSTHKTNESSKSLLDDLMEDEEEEKRQLKEERQAGRKGKRGERKNGLARLDPLSRPTPLASGGYGEEGGFDGYGSSDEERGEVKKKKGNTEMTERAEEAMKRNRDKQRAEVEVQRLSAMMDAKAKGITLPGVDTTGGRKRGNDEAIFGEWDGGGKKSRK